ncbi:MAG: TIGR03619 family F420-dependent LLM class oxidoreductase [Acidimicrobiia bacterium]|nr:TIGR03619 family F420-dependent LLM class oxidoreductase [Acidimicrobiia bacterium]
MRFGYLTVNSVDGIRPDVLASELEQRGFDSIWAPEHSHIPTGRDSAYPGRGDLPDGYWHMMDPFVSLMAAASATTTLTLATGVCLVLEHDLLDLACETATLDVLSGGRLLLGIGVGWNREELANHRPDVPFGKRYSAMRERVAALRAAWTEEEASFSGTYDRFDSSWVYPKPVRGTVPVALGNAGPVGIKHAAAFADEWVPIDAQLMNTGGKPDPAGGIELFRRLAAEAGRDPDSIPITLFAWTKPPKERIETYASLGVGRLVLAPHTMMRHDESATLARLDDLGDLIEQYS